MTQDEKQLLLKDLCARLPYDVKIDREWIAPMSGSPEHCTEELDTFDIEIIKISIELKEEGDDRDGKMIGLTICDDGKNHFVRGYMCKPYLRPMSSITTEDWLKLKEWIFIASDTKGKICFDGFKNISAKDTIKAIDYLISHHFDFRSLIEKGLALEAPEDMYETTKV